MIHKNDLKAAIQKLGLSGHTVCIHSSMKSFGEPVEEGPRTLAEAFLENQCTILVPTFSYQFSVVPDLSQIPPRNGMGEDFFTDEESHCCEVFSSKGKAISTEDMGIFPEYLLNRDDAFRGDHPLNSFTAVGNGAKELAQAQTAQDVYAPLRMLCEQDGFLLLAGVTLNQATIIHYAEQLAGRTLFIRWAKGKNGQNIPVAVGSCSEGFEHLSSVVKPYERTIMVGNSLWRCFPARELVKACQQAILENPQITHCGESHCSRCEDATAGGPILPADFWETAEVWKS
ncbi:MAG: AAC(3) family N-acetyltransferase [Massiliimalia sp.]|jgi:aminoglycoside N3'-acetyltransferase